MHGFGGGEINPLQRHGRRGGLVVELDPIRQAGRGIGEPFVEGEAGDGGERGGHVCGVDGRRGQRPVAADSADGIVRKLQAESEGVNPVGGCIVERNGFAAAVEAEAGVQAGSGVRRGIAPNGEVAIGGNRRRGKDKFPRIAVIGETPTGEVDRVDAGIAKFDPVGERAAVVHRAEILGHEFVQINRLRGRRGIGGAGRAVGGGAGLPVGGGIGVAERVDDFERTPAYIGGGRPAGGVLVIHGGDDVAERVEEREMFARVLETAAEPAGWIHAGIAHSPRVGVGARAEHNPRAARDGRALRENKVDGAEIEAADIHRHAGKVL